MVKSVAVMVVAGCAVVASAQAVQAQNQGTESGAVLGADSKVLGSSTSDLVYTPVAPCRIINTLSAGGILTGGSQRPFRVVGSTAGVFELQGGNPGGCGIPTTATSVQMNFVAVAPVGAGNLRAFAFGTTAPLASVINYAAVTGLNIANGIAQPICNNTPTACANDLIIQADVSSTHVIVDVVGYFAAPAKTGLVCQTLTAFGTIPSNTYYTINSPVCPAGTTMTGGGIDTTFDSAAIYVYASKPSTANTAWTCTARSLYASPWTFNCHVRCCSTPGN